MTTQKSGKHSEIERLERAMKNGRITPLDGKYRAETTNPHFTNKFFENDYLKLSVGKKRHLKIEIN